jgi:hypothetical protein
VADASEARLEASGPVAAGEYRLEVAVGTAGEPQRTAFRVTADAEGALAVTGKPAPPPAQETLSDRLGAQLERTRKRLRTSARDVYWAIRRR